MIRIIERQGAEPKYHDSVVRMWTKERELRFQCVGDAENDYSAARFDLLIEAETAAEMIWRGHKDITPQTICEYLRKKNSLAGGREVSIEREEGDRCPRPDCLGVMVVFPVENCSCHISPPCRQCETNDVRCAVCGWMNGEPITEKTMTPELEALERRVKWLEEVALVLMSKLNERTISIAPVMSDDQMHKLLNKWKLTEEQDGK